MNLVVGCPVSDRNWILPLWKKHVEQALEGLSYEFLFVVEHDDYDTLDLLGTWDKTSVMIMDKSYKPYVRDWGNKNRLRYLTDLRNVLLSGVREIQPDYFMSLDSDILLDKETIKNLIDTAENFNIQGKLPWAVGGKTYMDQIDPRITSAGWWSGHYFSRVPDNNRNPVVADLIMACKLMKLEAYSVPYEYHVSGEDIGWCKAVQAEGGVLAYDGRVANKHVMTPEWLGLVDKRVGW